MTQDQGIILRLHPLRETSVIVVWLTGQHGLVRTVAKGSRKITSPFSGHLDLFFHNELSWIQSRTSNLHQLTSTHIVNSRQAIRQDYPKLSLVSYFAKLILASLEEESPAPDFYHLLQRATNYLETSPASKLALFHFEKELSKLHGIYQKDQTADIVLKRQLGKLPSQRERLCQSLPEK